MSDGDVQAKMAEFEAVQQRLRQIDAHLSNLEAQAHEVSRALKTLEEIAVDQKGLVPIGGGFHVRATLHGDAPVVVPIGAGYAADQSVEQATAILTERAAAMKDRLRRSEVDADKLAATAQQMAQQIQAMQQSDA
jgi:prefoldin alpha subunit